jgi:hypothetical protein
LPEAAEPARRAKAENGALRCVLSHANATDGVTVPATVRRRSVMTRQLGVGSVRWSPPTPLTACLAAGPPHSRGIRLGRCTSRRLRPLGLRLGPARGRSRRVRIRGTTHLGAMPVPDGGYRRSLKRDGRHHQPVRVMFVPCEGTGLLSTWTPRTATIVADAMTMRRATVGNADRSVPRPAPVGSTPARRIRATTRASRLAAPRTHATTA